jgi:hypothetical protein
MREEEATRWRREAHLGDTAPGWSTRVDPCAPLPPPPAVAHGRDGLRAASRRSATLEDRHHGIGFRERLGRSAAQGERDARQHQLQPADEGVRVSGHATST